MQEVHFDAVLKNWAMGPVVGARLVGLIYEDKRERFPDGVQIVTSSVQEVFQDVNTSITYVKTQNSIYKLVL